MVVRGTTWLLSALFGRSFLLAEAGGRLAARIRQQARPGAPCSVGYNPPIPSYPIDIPFLAQPGALSSEEIAEFLELGTHEAFRRRHWEIHPCSAVTGDGLVDGVDWMVGDIASRIFLME